MFRMASCVVFEYGHMHWFLVCVPQSLMSFPSTIHRYEESSIRSLDGAFDGRTKAWSSPENAQNPIARHILLRCCPSCTLLIRSITRDCVRVDRAHGCLCSVVFLIVLADMNSPSNDSLTWLSCISSHAGAFAGFVGTSRSPRFAKYVRMASCVGG